MLPSLAEASLVVKQTQFLYNVVHDQVNVDLRLVTHRLLVRSAQLTHLTDVKSLVRI